MAAALACLTWEIRPDHPQSSHYRQRLLDRYSENLGQHSGLLQTLSWCCASFKARKIDWGVVTNKPKLYAVPLLERLKINAPLLICPEDGAQKAAPRAASKGRRAL